MYRPAMIIVAVALIGCVQPTAPQAVVETTQEETMPEEITVTPDAPSEPSWTPEPLHVYILDSGGDVHMVEACTHETYSQRLNAYRLSVELYNRDEHAGHPFTAVGGGWDD